MFISFCPNVYWVKGARYSCIYDLQQLKFYHLAENETGFIDKVVGAEESNLTFDSSEETALRELLALGLLEKTNGNVRYGEFEVGDIRPQITMAWIEVTQQCNLKCVHCYNESAPVSLKKMKMEEFQKVVHDLEELGVRKVQLIGGEPLCLGNQLREMITFARPHFSEIEVFTNGTLRSDKMADFFAENSIHVALSVYSYQADMHDMVTKFAGSHAKTIDAIEKIKVRGIPYRVANVLMKRLSVGNKNTDLFTLSDDHDVVRMSGRANLNLLTKDLILKRLITKSSFSAPLNKGLVCRNLVGHNCFSRRVYIAADLKVYPCVMERRLCHGSIVETSLSGVLKNEILTMGKNHIEGCKDCEFRYCCHDCRPDSITGKVDEKPWRCTYDPYTGQWLDPQSYAENVLRCH